MEVAGIILTSSMFHYSGNDEKPAYRWTGETWIPEMIHRYAEVYSNLVKHDPDYPTPQSLLDVYRIGNISDVGEMEEETEGSNFLMDLMLDQDERPLYIHTWGGTNTTARALKSIQERFEGTSEWAHIKSKIESKVVLYIILDQDGTYGDYISKNWNLTTLNDSLNFGYFGYGWKNLPKEIRSSLDDHWHQSHILNKGSLIEKYALIGDGYYLAGEIESEQFGQEKWLEAHPDYKKYDFISEGDSLSYFYLIQTSLRGFEHPTYGSWGGRFTEVAPNTFSTEKTVDYNPLTQRFEQEYGFYRWINDIQADFAARVQWCVTNDFEACSHYPEVNIDENISAKVGENLTLRALAKDPNGLSIAYHWWCYYEASTYWDFSHLELEAGKWTLGDMEFIDSWHSSKIEKTWDLPMVGVDTNQISFQIPEDAKSGDTFHIILEVSNQSDFSLKTYKRVIITVE